MGVVFLLLLLLLPLPLAVHAEDLGELSANPFNPDSTSNPFVAGSPFKPDGVNNSFSPYVEARRWQERFSSLECQRRRVLLDHGISFHKEHK